MVIVKHKVTGLTEEMPCKQFFDSQYREIFDLVECKGEKCASCPKASTEKTEVEPTKEEKRGK